MDRSFSSWETGAPGVDHDVDVSDYRKLEASIMGTLRFVAGYPDPNREGGIFEDKRMVHSYLAKLDTTKKTKFIAEMAGLLWYRALPLAKHARSFMEKQSSSEQLFEQLEEELSSAKVQLDKAREELLQGHRKISALQDEVSSLKDTVISLKDDILEKSVNVVQTVVKNEMQSYSTVLETAATAVNQACTSALAPSKIRSAIASAATDRSSNLIVYGLCEDAESSDSEKVKEIFEYLVEAPVISEVVRLGRSREEQIRPVKVVLRSGESVRGILGKASRLKESGTFRSVYVAPDRTLEERVERRTLVANLKERRKSEPEKVWVIRQGSVVGTEKTERAQSDSDV